MSADFVKENCDLWVDYAYNNWLLWVRQVKPEQYNQRDSTRILVSRMRNAFFEGVINESWKVHEQLKKLGNSIFGMRNDFGGNSFLYEQAEINLECAVIAYKMGDRHEAGALLEMTSGSFVGISIQAAVVCWISGCIHWQSQSHFDSALVNWEKAFRIVTELAGNSSFEESFSAGCETIARDMGRAIRKASRAGYPPHPLDWTEPQPNPGPQPGAAPSSNPGPSPRPRNPGGNPGYTSARLRTFPIIGSIPAGSPIGIVDDSDDVMISDRFEIDGYFYKAYNLRGGAFINLNQNQRYYLLKVKGDSMNNALPVNIEDGDYVIMVKQDGAGSGDIVAAEIDSKDREATLKRYYHRDGRYILEPQSRNPALKEHLTFTKDFYIRGKAIAVLKRDG